MSNTDSLIRLRENPVRTKAVVFIHGIGARDPQEYWKQFTEVLLRDTQAFTRDIDVYVWGYPTNTGPKWLIDFIHSLSRKTLVDATPAIVRLGNLWRSTYQAQFSDYQYIGLVCHSMGGLLVQSWITDVLEEGQSSELDHLRHIAFYSTPHSGAPIAGVSLNDQLEGMTVTSDFVGRTRRRWHDHIVKWKDLQLKPEDSLYNRYIPHLVLSGINDQVVPRNFAEIVGMPCRDVDGNHTTLIQPVSVNDTRYKIWRNEFEKILSSTNLPETTIKELPNPQQVINQNDATNNQMLNSTTLATPSSQITLEKGQITSQKDANFSEEHTPNTFVDFLISYADADLPYAEWITTQLKEEGYSTILRAWDFEPGANYITEMEEATTKARRTIVILSPSYLQEFVNHPDWKVALFKDISGKERKLVPVYVREFGQLNGLLGPIMPINLIGKSETAARELLLRSLRPLGTYPTTRPPFPGETS